MAAKECMVTPSTSLPGAIASKAARSSMCAGTGCCSKMPCTPGSADSPVIVSTRASVVVSVGSSTCRDDMPAFRDRFSFIRT